MIKQTRQIKPTRRSVSGLYAFRKDHFVAFESTLERDFIKRQEFLSSVLDVIPQPCQIPFVGLNGQSHTYTPDFLVYYRMNPMRSYGMYPKPRLIEVKPEAEWRTHWRSWLPKWKAAYRYAKEQGWEFHIHDESRIRDQILENIRFLDRYSQMRFPVEETNQVLDTLEYMGCAPFHYLVSRHFMGIYASQGIAHIWHLLATRQVVCDMSRPLTHDTELWLVNHD